MNLQYTVINTEKIGVQDVEDAGNKNSIPAIDVKVRLYNMKKNQRMKRMSLRSFRKLNIQMLILTLCIAIPVLALISYVGLRSNQAQLKELLMEEQADVQSRVFQIDSLLEMLENSLSYLGMEDTQIRSIAVAKEQDNQFWLDNNAVLQKLKNQTVINPLQFTTFIYYPKQNIFYNSEVDPDFVQVIRRMTEEPDFRTMSGNWETGTCGSKHYLYLLLDYQDYIIGAFAPFGAFYDDLNPSDLKAFYYTDPEGTILDEGPYLSAHYQISAASTQAPFILVKQISKERIDTRMTSVYIYVAIVACVFAVLLIAYIVFLNIWILSITPALWMPMKLRSTGNIAMS